MLRAMERFAVCLQNPMDLSMGWFRSNDRSEKFAIISKIFEVMLR